MIQAAKIGLCLLLAGLSACGVSPHATPDGAVVEAGVCGTADQPGILKLANLAPAMGSIVANQSIVHGFVVVGAPAEFNNFDLRFTPSHTAGLPIPEKPKFTMTTVGSDIIYQLTIDAWSTAPSHVELMASGGYQTKRGCAWDFPSPLFSYDLVAGPDGGLVREAGGAGDGPALDSGGVIYRLDAPMKLDLPGAETSGGLDTGATRETRTGIDGTTAEVDAAIDSADDKPAIGAGID